MLENIGKIRQNRETNSNSVKEQKRIIQDEIQELRDMGGDISATIIWACLSFLRKKTISQGFDSTTTLANV
jgi:hypothetical protein